DKLTELIAQLLDLSRLQSGTLHTRPRLASLQDLVDSSMHEFMALTVHHDLVIDVEPDLPRLFIDQQRIVQVLTNLIDNSAKFAREGSKITLAAKIQGQTVRISVSDEGPGIPAAYRAWVFEAFRRVEESPMGRSRGAGLGLTICKKLIEAHGGKIWIE